MKLSIHIPSVTFPMTRTEKGTLHSTLKFCIALAHVMLCCH